jgi:hypothetical protein
MERGVRGCAGCDGNYRAGRISRDSANNGSAKDWRSMAPWADMNNDPGTLCRCVIAMCGVGGRRPPMRMMQFDMVSQSQCRAQGVSHDYEITAAWDRKVLLEMLMMI